MKAELVVEMQATLGEGPMWHSVHQMLYWVDIENRMLHGFEPHSNLHREWRVPRRVGTVAAADNGQLILGLQGEISSFDPANGAMKRLVPIEAEIRDNRCNDGKCDPSGRFWVGTMQLECKPGTGALYCLDSNMKLHSVLTDLTIANGMDWSPDGKYMYFIDSATYCVKRYLCNPEEVSLSEEEVVLRFDEDGGMPDGMCADSEGMLWIAFWGGKRVGRYDPSSGKHLADVEVPAPHVTSCCFGGNDLRTLYITTAREGLNERQIEEYPVSGGLFKITIGIKGKDSALFRHG